MRGLLWYWRIQKNAKSTNHVVVPRILLLLSSSSGPSAPTCELGNRCWSIGHGTSHHQYFYHHSSLLTILLVAVTSLALISTLVHHLTTARHSLTQASPPPTIVRVGLPGSWFAPIEGEHEVEGSIVILGRDRRRYQDFGERNLRDGEL